MADIDKIDEKEVTAPLSIKKPEVAGEEDQTAKIPRPPKPENKPVLSVDINNDAVPLKPKDEEDEEKTAKLPKLTKPIEKPAPEAPSAAEEEENAEETIAMEKDEVAPIKKPATGEDDQTAKIPKPQKDDKKVVLNSATDSAIRPSDATTMAPAVVPDNIDMRKTESGNVEVIDNLSAPVPAVAKQADAGGASSTPAPFATPAGETKGRKTIKLKPLKKDTPAAATAAAPEEENAEETLSMDRSSLLEDEKNMPSLAGGGPAATAAAPAEEEVAESGSLEDESTVKIQKPQMTKPAHPTPIVPGSKETIKLRPSTTPPPPVSGGADITKTEPAAVDESEDTVAVSKKTIRLVPKMPGEDDSTQKTPKAAGPTAAAPAAAPALGSAKPSAPTVKMQEPDDVTQKTARPSAPTVKMPEPSADAAAPPAASDKPSASKKTLKLKATSPTAPPPQASSDPNAGMPPADGGLRAAAPTPIKTAAGKGADPGVVMTLVALLTLIAIAYYAWMVGGQWAEQYQEVDNANVPALSGKVK